MDLRNVHDRTSCSTIIYDKQHIVDVFHPNQTCTQQTIFFTVTKEQNGIKMKVRDATNYEFNFSILIDEIKFEDIRNEQCLHITFNQFQTQIVDLLNQTVNKQMQLRLDITESNAKLIFHKNLPLKMLIFLSIELTLTNVNEIITELSDTVKGLKECKKSLATELTSIKNQLCQTELIVETTMSKCSIIEKQFYNDLDLILKTFLSKIKSTETSISTELIKVAKRHEKLLGSIAALEKQNYQKQEFDSQLIMTIQSLRIENEKQQRMINEVKSEIEWTKVEKNKFVISCENLEKDLSEKDNMLQCLQQEMKELRKDMEDATLILFQKNETNQEIRKNLTKANLMLANSHTRNNTLSIEIQELKEAIESKNKIIEDLEKEYRNVIKINAMLTKKLSDIESIDKGNLNLPFSSSKF